MTKEQSKKSVKLDQAIGYVRIGQVRLGYASYKKLRNQFQMGRFRLLLSPNYDNNFEKSFF